MAASIRPTGFGISTPRRLRFADWVIDLDRASLSKGAEDRKLRPKSFEVLCYLARHPRRVVSKSELLSAIWQDAFVSDNVLVQSLLEIRRALGDDSQQLIKTVARRGYLFEAEVVAEATGETEPPAAALPPVSPKVAFNRRWLLAWAALAILLVGGLLGLSRMHQMPVRESIDTVAVLPFQEVGSGSRDEALDLGLADALITSLSNLKYLTVRATSSVKDFVGSTDPVAAGQALRVGAVVTGTVQKVDGRVRVNVRLVSVADGKAIWAGSYEEPFRDIFSLEDAVSTRITEALSIPLSGDEAKRVHKRYTSDAEAYELYMRGRFFWEQRTRASLERAVTYFDQAIKRDPRYAAAYAGVANSYGPMLQQHFIRVADGLPRMIAAADKAVGLDPDLADGHTAMAATRFNQWNFPGAEQESRRAIELNPSDPLPHMWYGYYLSSVGRWKDDLEQRRRAFELDPLNIVAGIGVGTALHAAGRSREAVDSMNKTLELSPGFPMIHDELANILGDLKQFPEALEEFRKAGDELSIAWVQAAAGNHSDARKTLAQYLHSADSSSIVPEIEVAEVYAALDDREAAFRSLQKAYDEHDPKLMFLGVNRRFESFKSDSRFEDLLSRIRP